MSYRIEVIEPHPRRAGSGMVTRTERARTLAGAATAALGLIGAGAERLHILYTGGVQADLVAGYQRGGWTDRGGREVTVIGGIEVAR